MPGNTHRIACRKSSAKSAGSLSKNHTLLEHSLFFLQQLFQQVLERDTPLHLYNLNGHAFSSDIGGGLLETRV